MSRLSVLVLALALCGCPSRSHRVQPPPPTPATSPVVLADLQDNQAVRGFHVVSLYLDASDQPMGARFVHDGTGFVFDYLRIESAPQGFVWVNSFPTSDQGEPHTQEHLLLGKGDRGRRSGNLEAMSLTDSSAFTDQWRTAYHFHTVAGEDVFWTVLADKLDALLNPDYTDEEIRREVSNFGVSADTDGTLRLEEKGTVYNEMVRTYEAPISLIWRVADHLVYGARHPLALSSGGYPDDIRTMTPEDIRSFHRDHYYLGNMGMIGSFPSSMELGAVLDRSADILSKLAGRTGDAMTEADLPAPQGATAGTTRIVDYPYADAGKASSVMLVWPATLELTLDDRTLLELFLSSVAGDESTNLYKKLIDGKTRVLDTGATGVWGYVRPEKGLPVYLGLEGVAASSLTEPGVEAIRAAVLAELTRIAALPAGDPELVALGKRIASRLTDSRRRLAKFLSSPPGFGFRGIGPEWMKHLLDLERTDGFRKSLTMKPALAGVDQALAADGNPWAERLARWGLLDTPYGIAGRPSPTLRQQLDQDRDARIAAELKRLGAQYGTSEAAEILARFSAEYDTATAALEAGAKASAMPAFIDSPPMTLDDVLQYQVTKIDQTVPLVASTIDSMTGGTVALAFRLDAVAEADLPFLAILPTLMSEAGLVIDGKPMASEDIKEAQRREILSLWASYQSDARTGRTELVVQGSGIDLDETRRALSWMAKTLTHPDWRVDNLARLRDVVDQSLNGYRSVMLGAEESWVDDPATIYWRQRWPLFAHTSSFLTQLHDLQRLRWMLADPGDAKVTAEVARYLRSIASAGGRLDRKKLDLLAAALQTTPKKLDKAIASHLAKLGAMSAPALVLVAAAGKDLQATLSGIPDDSLAADWAYLCKQMATDLETGAAHALERLEAVRRAVIDAGNARAWLVASSGNGKALRDDLDALVAGLDHGTLTRQPYSDAPLIDDRLRGRRPDATDPVFVGLVAPSTASGVHLHSVPGASYADTSDDAILDYLTGNLYSGQGGHSMFMKTWAAGLAYSNGLRPSIGGGRLRYYAERCPELPTTLKFVIGELSRAKADPALVDYAVAQSFSSRIAASYESRAAGIAGDLADGVTPELVRGFRDRLLAVRGRDGVGAELFRRLPEVYGRVLPGWGTPSREVDDGVFFVIGPDPQLDAWASYLLSAEGKDAVLHRLYPRDFWAVGTVR